MNSNQFDLKRVIDRLEFVSAKTREIKAELELISDYSSAIYIDKCKKLADYEEEYSQLIGLKRLIENIRDAQSILNSNKELDLQQLAEEELKKSIPLAEALYDDIFSESSKYQTSILEIRAGAGGDESSLFAQDLFRMYTFFIKSKGGEIEVTDSEISEAGGYKSIKARIEGKNIYKYLEFESGVHRVQRIPSTENAGRIHTSTVTVAILPEVEDIEIEINPNDLIIESFKAGGPGGQNVNKNKTAIRVIHKPTGIIIECKDGKQQQRNKELALRELQSKLYQIEKEKQDSKISGIRKSQIGTASRSEKIRTYNYPQNRITDHRIKKSWYNLTEVINGDLEELLTETRFEMNRL